jgi:putative ABC transport system permease protein
VLTARFVLLAQHALNRLEKRLFGTLSILVLASRNVTRNISRAAAVVAGLMAGGSVMVGTATFSVSLFDRMTNWLEQTVPGDLYTTSGIPLGGLGSGNALLADDFGAKLLAIPGVERIRPIRFADVRFHDAPVRVVSSPIRTLIMRSKLLAVEGKPDEIATDLIRGDIAVGENLSRRFGVRRGDSIELGVKAGSKRFRVAGVVQDYSADRGSILMDRGTYVREWGDDRVDTFELFVRDGADVQRVRKQIGDRLGAAHNLFVLTGSEYRTGILSAIQRIFSLLRVLEFVTLFVALLGLITAVFANVLDRVREIGVLRAIGTLRSQVRSTIVAEAILLGALGCIAGVLVGSWTGFIVLRHVVSAQTGWNLPYLPPFGAIAELAAIAIPLAAIAGLFPAQKAAQLKISDALEYE